MIDELHARDIRLILWQIPLIKLRPHPTGQAKVDAATAVRDGVLVQELAPDGSLRPYRNRGWWFPLGLMPDLTDERAARWWTDKRRYLVEELGVDGFKTDGGEHAWGRDLRYLDGTGGDEGNARFPVAYAKAFGDLLRSAGKPPVTFSRAGYTGSQAHGTFWAGDENSSWEAFRWSMFAGLSASACGILYWGWDFAGFSGDVPTAELYLRSLAAATFVPIMQYHSEFNHHRTPSRDRTPWNIAERTGDERVLPVSRRFVQLRERLVPYLAEETRHAIAAGEPLMRPLFFDAPQRPRGVGTSSAVDARPRHPRRTRHRAGCRHLDRAPARQRLDRRVQRTVGGRGPRRTRRALRRTPRVREGVSVAPPACCVRGGCVTTPRRHPRLGASPAHPFSSRSRRGSSLPFQGSPPRL